jgi:hypothetical protein
MNESDKFMNNVIRKVELNLLNELLAYIQSGETIGAEMLKLKIKNLKQ